MAESRKHPDIPIVGVRMSKADKALLQDAAKTEGRTLSDLVRKALEPYLLGAR